MFSQTAEYALRSMVWLALTPESLVPTTDLARATLVPAHYLAKVLQQLAAAGIINGRRGVGGGYQLARPARNITLREIVVAVMPLDRITACPLGIPCENLCDLHHLMDSLTAEVLRVLETRTLADLAESRGRGVPLCGAALDGHNGHGAALTIDRLPAN